MLIHFMRSALLTLLITSIIASSIAPSYAVRPEDLATNHNAVVIIAPPLSLQNEASEEQEHNKRLEQLGAALPSQYNSDIPKAILSNLNDDDHKNMRLVSKAWKKALETFEQQRGTFHAIPDDLIGFLRPTCRYAHVAVDRGVLDADMIRRIKWKMRSLEVMVKDQDAVEALLNETNSAQKLFVEVQEPITEDTIDSWLQPALLKRSLIDFDSLSVQFPKATTAITFLKNIHRLRKANIDLGIESRIKRLNVFIDQVMRDFTTTPDTQGQTTTFQAHVTPQDCQTLEDLSEEMGSFLSLYTRNYNHADPQTDHQWFLIPVPRNTHGQSNRHEISPTQETLDAILCSKYGIRPSTYQKVLHQNEKIHKYFFYMQCWTRLETIWRDDYLYSLIHIPFKQRDEILGKAQELLGKNNGHLLKRVLHILSSFPPKGRSHVVQCAKQIIEKSPTILTSNTPQNVPLHTLLTTLWEMSPEQREIAASRASSFMFLYDPKEFSREIRNAGAESSLDLYKFQLVKNTQIVISNPILHAAVLFGCTYNDTYRQFIEYTIGSGYYHYGTLMYATLASKPLRDFIDLKVGLNNFIFVNVAGVLNTLFFEEPNINNIAITCFGLGISLYILLAFYPIIHNLTR